MSELITDEMAHVAAKARYEAYPLYKLAADGSTDEPVPWDDLPLASILQRRAAARVALEATAPLIAGQALREFATDYRDRHQRGLVLTAYAADLADERADEHERSGA